MGSDFLQCVQVLQPGSFNPRSHMGSDTNILRGFDRCAVSIHAPTWRATQTPKPSVSSYKFQSTLPHGERPSNEPYNSSSLCFNPRSHMGSDISEADYSNAQKSFNPRSHMGSDIALPFLAAAFVGFNPRSHMGSDNCSPSTMTARRCFNPRSHMGSDPRRHQGMAREDVSIHAPTWGATQ